MPSDRPLALCPIGAAPPEKRSCLPRETRRLKIAETDGQLTNRGALSPSLPDFGQRSTMRMSL
jgi:hypothetical protein